MPIYADYPDVYMDCTGTSCGTEVSAGSDSEVSVASDQSYLVVGTRSGYCASYYEAYVGGDGASVTMGMVPSMATNQDRVLLSWDFMDDLDLWVYGKADRSNSVGCSGKTDSFAGGTITLDVDVQGRPRGRDHAVHESCLGLC